MTKAKQACFKDFVFRLFALRNLAIILLIVSVGLFPYVELGGAYVLDGITYFLSGETGNIVNVLKGNANITASPLQQFLCWIMAVMVMGFIGIFIYQIHVLRYINKVRKRVSCIE